MKMRASKDVLSANSISLYIWQGDIIITGPKDGPHYESVRSNGETSSVRAWILYTFNGILTARGKRKREF